VKNKELLKAYVLVVGFVLSLLTAVTLNHVPREVLAQALSTWAHAIAMYEVVVKRLLEPAFDKLTQ